MFTHLDILNRFFELLIKLMATSMRLGECSFSLKTVLNNAIKLLFSEQISRFKKLFRPSTKYKRRQKKCTH